MPELVVINEPLHYGGKQMAVGERFVATAADAKHFMRRARAKLAPARTPVRKVAETLPRAEPAPAADANAAPAEAPKPRHFYGTRRLKAED